MAETDAGRTALHASAEDNRVMLSLLTDCVASIRGQAVGAAAVTVTKVLSWEGLIGWFGQDMLVRRVAEILIAVTDDGMEISEEERAALRLAADYATGNGPQRPWERLVQQLPGADAALPYDDQATDAGGETPSTSASHERAAAMKDTM
jgi:hypothetical protein